MLDSRHIECYELLGNDIPANIDFFFMSFLIFVIVLELNEET